MTERKEMSEMAAFVPKQKMSKKAQKALNAQKRETWGSFSPVTKMVKSKKAYNRKKSLDRCDDYGKGLFVAA
jgi:hypothetical protein